MKITPRLASLATIAIIGLVPGLAGSVLATASSVRPATGTASWPEFHGHAADTGNNPYETIIGTGNVASLKQLWLASTSGTQSYSAPSVAGGRIFSSDGSLRAWNASTGAPEWTATAAAPVGDPAFGDGRLFADSGYNGGVYAFNASTGKQEWSYILPQDGSGSEPVFANGLVYVAGYFSMNAFNAATGAVVWSVSLNGLVRSVPALAGGRLFVATECCTSARHKQNFTVLDASTGAILWSRQVGSDVGIQGASPVISGDTVYQCSGSTLYALWVSHGYIRWSEPDGCDIDSTPALANGVLYTANAYSSDTWAINAATGAVLWHVAGQGIDNPAPAVANGVLYVPAVNDTIAAYNAATGAVLWTSPVITSGGTPSVAQPAIVNGILYTGGTAGLYAFAPGA